MAEVELGQLASSKAQSDQVKQFAQRMVTDHGKANDELKSLVQSKGVTLPADSGAHHKAMKDRLSRLSGAEFDRAYMQEMDTDHRKDVNAFRKESQSGKDAEVKAWAAKTLPTLEEHLQMAQSASRAAVGTSGTKTGGDTERGAGGRTRGTTGDTARPGSGSGAGGGGTSTGTGSRPGTGSGGATDGAGGTGPVSCHASHECFLFAFLRPGPGRARKPCGVYFALASSSSMTRLNDSNGWAPSMARPLMKNAGVPVTPTASAAAISASTPGFC